MDNRQSRPTLTNLRNLTISKPPPSLDVGIIKYNITFMDIEFTHYWITGFGWEVTIYLPTDFETVEEFGRDKDYIVFIGVTDSGAQHILKGRYIK